MSQWTESNQYNLVSRRLGRLPTKIYKATLWASGGNLQQVDSTCPSGTERNTFEVLEDVFERALFCEGDKLKTLGNLQE